jgi:hypothetical protein
VLLSPLLLSVARFEEHRARERRLVVEIDRENWIACHASAHGDRTLYRLRAADPINEAHNPGTSSPAVDR